MAELVRAPVSHRARPARSGADPDRIRGARQRLDQLADLPAPVDAGRPLPPRLADFGADLATIRLHHDWFADELTGALDAEAVTHGPHVYLAADAPDPSTPAGWMLMVHELFHSISHHAPGSSSEEPEAERAGLVASRASEAADGPPVVLADPTGPDPVDRRESGPLPRPRFAGARRLGRRARAASVRAGSDKSRVPDVVSAGEALVRLVSRLFERNPDDHGGRLASVLARLEPRLRDDVVTAVADRSGGHVGAQLHELEGQRPAEDGGHPVDGDGPTVDFIEKPGATDPDADQAPPVGETPRVARASRVGESPAAGGTPADIIGPAAEPTPGEGSDTPADRTSGAAPPAATEGAGGELGGDSVADEQSPARAAVQTPPVEPPSSTGATTPAGPAGAAPGEAPAPEVPMGGEAPTATGPLPGTAAADGPASGPSVAPDGEPTSAGIEPEVAATPAEPADPQTTDPDAGSAPVGSALADGAADGDTMGGGAATGEQIEDVTEADIPGTETAGPEPLSAPVDNAEADAGRVPEIDQRPTEDASTSSADDSAEPAPESAPEPEPATESEATAPESSSTGGASASGEPAAPPESTGPERVGSTDGTVDSATSGGGPADNRVEPATETEPATEPTADPAGAAADPAAVAAAAGISTTGAGDGGELTDPPVPSGGGGGGGAAIADKPVADPPDVSAMDPAGALGAAAAMPATRLLVALGGVTAAAGREIGAENADLTAHPPSMQRPSGVPADRDASLPPAALPPLPVAPDRTVPGLAGGPGAEPPTAAARGCAP
ncbi:eCIS core domain-containing protein, partial [Nakamurella sp.]|uniref:eCIS core domain-containing protein n=1 Tax=Nakamurella sp. TaxID=1869182 RepID=UPI003B3AF4E9